MAGRGRTEGKLDTVQVCAERMRSPHEPKERTDCDRNNLVVSDERPDVLKELIWAATILCGSSTIFRSLPKKPTTEKVTRTELGGMRCGSDYLRGR